MKRRKGLRIALIVLLLICIAGIVAVGVPTVREATQKESERVAFDSMQERYKKPGYTQKTADGTVTEVPDSVDSAALKAANPDYWAWVEVPGTVIDYPVMFTPEEPEKYLHLDFDGNWAYSGVPFMFEKTEGDCPGYILFGHNMLNGTMFSDVSNFFDKDYAQQHRKIILHTEDGCQEYRVIACISALSDDEWYTDGNLEDVLQKAVVLFDEDITPGTETITLSTCRDAEGPRRILLVGVRVK